LGSLTCAAGFVHSGPRCAPLPVRGDARGGRARPRSQSRGTSRARCGRLHLGRTWSAAQQSPLPSDANSGRCEEGRSVTATEKAGPIRVMLVDDHEVVRRGIVTVIDASPALTVIGEASSVAEATRRLPAIRPEVLVV